MGFSHPFSGEFSRENGEGEVKEEVLWFCRFFGNSWLQRTRIVAVLCPLLYLIGISLNVFI